MTNCTQLQMMLLVVSALAGSAWAAGSETFPTTVSVSTSASAPELFAANSLVDGLNAIAGAQTYKLEKLAAGTAPKTAVIAVGYGAATAVGLPVSPVQ
jgi:hypothetical protein